MSYKSESKPLAKNASTKKRKENVPKTFQSKSGKISFSLSNVLILKKDGSLSSYNKPKS